MAGKALKCLRGVLLAILVLVLATTGAVVWVLGSQAGTRFAVEQALGFVPQAQIEVVNGSVWSGVRLGGLNYAADGVVFNAGELWLELNWHALLSGELHVRRLGLADASLSLPEGDSESEPRGDFDLEALLPKLPIAVNVEALELLRVTVVTGPDAQEIVLDALRLSAVADAEAFTISDLSLALDAPVHARLEMKASLAAAAPHDLSLSLNGRLAVEQGEGVVDLRSSGPLTDLRTEGMLGWQGVDLPSAELALDIRHGFDSARIERFELDGLQGAFSLRGDLAWATLPVWEIEAQASNLHLNEWVDALEGPLSLKLQSRGQLQADGTLHHATRLTDASGQAGGVGVDALLADISGGLDHAQIESLSVELLGGRVQAEGLLSWGDDIAWKLELLAQSLDPGVLAPAAAGRFGFELGTEGSFKVEDGTLQHVSRLQSLTGELAGIGFEAIGLTVSGDLEQVTVDDFSGRVLGAALAGEAKLSLAEPIRWSASLSLDEADLSLLGEHVQPAPRGFVGLDLVTQGELRDGAPYGEFAIDHLRGEIEGQQLAGQVMAVVAGEMLKLSPAEIELGHNRVLVSGQVTPPFDLRFELALPALETLPLLAQLGVSLTGRVEGHGEVSGTLAEPRVNASIEAATLAMGEVFSLAGLTVQAAIDATQLDVTARLQGLFAGEEQIPQATVQATGSLQAHRLALDADTSHGRLALSGEGGLADDSVSWRGNLLSLTLVDTLLGDWALESAAALLVGPESLALDAACLAQSAQQGRLCLSARRASATAPLDATLEADLALAMADEWLPDAVSLPGWLSLRATARMADTVSAEVKLALPDDILLYSGLTDESISIAYRDVSLDARLASNRLQAIMAGELIDYGTLKGELSAQLDGRQVLTGKIGFDMQSIAWLQAFAPDLEQLDGSARLELALGGTLAEPRPSGELWLDQLGVIIPTAGVGFTDSSLSVTVDDDQVLRLEGRILGREQGELRIEGEGRVSMPDWAMSVSLDGDALAVMRSPEIDLDISPALRIEATPKVVTVTGKIVLPLVAVRVHTLPPGTVAESPDLVLADATEEGPPAMALRTDLEVVLGDRVSLEGMGFSTGLSGQIRVRGDEVAPLSAYGEVDLRDGRYNAYGQNLAVDQGRLSFNGPLDDPGLDVRASRTVGEYQAGLQIRGTLNNPRSEVFSVPALPESDALSLLLTGRLLSAGSSGADANLLLNALGSLGLAQTDEILGDIGQKIGFDEIGLDTGNGFGAAQLSVGKRLSSRLMVRYMVGVFDGVGRLVTEYRINRFLDLEIVSSPVAQGGDLIYRIER